MSASAFSQLKPKVAVIYSSDKYLSDASFVDLSGPSVKTGMSYTYKLATVYFNNTFWMDKGHGYTFAPKQSKFDIGLELRRGFFKARLEHSCLHPISTSGKEFRGIYGGGTSLALSYGY